MHKILFYSKFISCLYMFRAPCAHCHEAKLYYTASGIITPVGRRPVHGTATYSCDDTRGCIIQFGLLTMSTWCSKNVEA